MQITLLQDKHTLLLKETFFFVFLPPAHIYFIVPILVASFFCSCSFSRCHGFHSTCTDISDRIKNKAGRKASGGPSLQGGRSALSSAGPEGSDSVTDYRTVISSSAPLMCSHCHKEIKKNPKTSNMSHFHHSKRRRE